MPRRLSKFNLQNMKQLFFSIVISFLLMGKAFPQMDYSPAFEGNFRNTAETGTLKTVDKQSVQILCPQIGENGEASLYDSYTFSITSQDKEVTNHQWEYKLKKTDDSYELISSSSYPAFTIEPQEPSSFYYMDSEKNIIGEISLSCKVDGVDVQTVYHLLLQCKPGEISYSFEINPINEYYYYVDITLYSKAADFFMITTKDYNSEIAFNEIFYEYQDSKYRTINLSYGSEVQFRFKAFNDFGIRECIVNLPPVDYETAGIHVNSESFEYDFYTIKGQFLERTSSISEFINNNANGTYIIVSIDRRGNRIESSKIIIRR